MFPLYKQMLQLIQVILGSTFNLDGEVVGINSQIYSRSGAYQGVSFAIPIDVAIEVAEQIINKGEASRGYLGVPDVQGVEFQIMESRYMEKPYGLLLITLEKINADNADLKAGDVIIEFNGEEVKFAGDLPHIGRLELTQANAQIIRNGKEITLEFTLGKLEILSALIHSRHKSETSNNPMGLQVENLSDATDEIDHGVADSTVDSDSASSGKKFSRRYLLLIFKQVFKD